MTQEFFGPDRSGRVVHGGRRPGHRPRCRDRRDPGPGRRRRPDRSGPDPVAERIDGRGLVLAPGLCDLHAPSPGTWRRSGRDGLERCAGGARGRFTTVCAMPNTEPPLDSASAVADISSADGACRVRVIGAATIGRSGEPATWRAWRMPGRWASRTMAPRSATRPSPEGHGTARRARAAARRARGRCGARRRRGHARGPRGAANRTGWLAAEAEVRVVERDIAIAEETGARLHVTHLSTPAARSVRSARSRGVAVPATSPRTTSP